MKRFPLILILVACAAAYACESNKSNSAWSAKPSGEEQIGTTLTPATPPPSAITSGKGVGPVDHVDLASLDESREDSGAKLFQEKCSACHKLSERYIGPALTGVTERRQPEWILNMILNPEVMVAQDPTAKALLAEFIAPMANQHLTREEAECILVYFREHDEEIGEDGKHEDELEDDGTSGSHQISKEEER